MVAEWVACIDNNSALKQVKKGILWEIPPLPLHHHQMDVKASWKSFHQSGAFHWFPAKMLAGLNWKKNAVCAAATSM
jgi:hypothetical protein